MDWINGENLNGWANNQDAPSQLPQLVRKLIFATSDVQHDVQHIDMPADGGIGKPGFDGIVKSQTGNAFVPIRKSVWEMGCGQDPQTKANEDYNKRKKDGNQEISFVFVTPRRWQGKRNWITERNKENIWKEVKAYDADDLATWLEQAPGVELWLSSLIGTRPHGVYDLESWWEDNWAQATKPQLTPEVILAKRNDIAQKILAEIKTNKNVSIEGSSVASSIAFLSATFLTDPEKQSEHFLSRAIIVDNQEAVRRLAEMQNNLILIPRGQEAIQACSAANNKGHIVCICRDPEIRSDKKNVIKIPYPRRYFFHETLENFFEQEDKNGIEARSKAERLTRETGMDLEVLRQNLAVSDITETHEWARSENTQDLVAALFVGQWDSNQDLDKKVLSYISGKDYSDLENVYRRLRDTSNAPLRYTLGIWKLTSPVFAWKNIARQASRDQWDKFREVAKNIILSPENFTEGWNRHELKKEGVAQSLAILGNRMSEDDCPHLNSSPKTWVDDLVREILKQPAIFAKQSSFLFDLSEAAPEVFLESLEDFIDKNPSSKLTKAIAQNTSLMWVLGSLAWVQTYLSRVTRCLGYLAKEIENEQFVPIPRQTPHQIQRQTLRQIFLPWLPQTETSAEERIKILEGLARNNSNISWQLLMDVFPKNYPSSMYHPMPVWLDFTPRPDPTYKEYFEHVGDLLDLVIDNIGSDISRWQEVLDHIASFPSDKFPYLRSNIEKYTQQLDKNIHNFNEKEKISIWKALNDFVCQHRQYAWTQWALSEEDIQPWDVLRKQLTPKDLIILYSPLFNPGSKIDVLIPENKSYEETEKIFDEKRKDALEKICDGVGEDGLKKLVKNCENTWSIARNLTNMSDKILSESNITVEMLMEGWLDKEGVLSECAITYFSKKNGDNLNVDYASTLKRKAKDDQWSNQKIANMLTAFPCNPETWKLTSEFDQEVEKLYWESRFISCPEKEEYKLRFIKKSLQFNQLAKANPFVNHNHKKLPGELVAEFLEKAAEDQEAISRLDGHWIPEMITEMILGLRGRIDDDRLMNIETTYSEQFYFDLNSISGKSRDQHLVGHRKIAEKPELFVEYIEASYKKKSDESITELSPEQKRKAKQGGFLMQTWSLAPGTQEDGTINSEQLLNWVETARTQLDELDRIGIGDNQIGEMLGRVPLEGKDGIWPIEAIRAVLEKVKSEEMKEGICIGLFNSQPAYTVSAGHEQKKTSEKYARQAQTLDKRWPETAKLLRTISESYKGQSNWERERAERDSFLE